MSTPRSLLVWDPVSCIDFHGYKLIKKWVLSAKSENQSISVSNGRNNVGNSHKWDANCCSACGLESKADGNVIADLAKANNGCKSIKIILNISPIRESLVRSILSFAFIFILNCSFSFRLKLKLLHVSAYVISLQTQSVVCSAKLLTQKSKEVSLPPISFPT